jgi:hypothetical protein
VMIAQHLGNGEIAQQTGRHGQLKCKPVLTLPNIENVTGVSRTCCAAC